MILDMTVSGCRQPAQWPCWAVLSHSCLKLCKDHVHGEHQGREVFDEGHLGSYYQAVRRERVSLAGGLHVVDGLEP